MDRRSGSSARRSLKRKLEQEDFHENIDVPLSPQNHQDLLADVGAQVQVLNTAFSWSESDRAAAKRATHHLSELAKNGLLLISSVSCFLWRYLIGVRFLDFCDFGLLLVDL